MEDLDQLLAVRMARPRRRRRVACVIGTRPEAIKMAPVIRRLKAAPWCEVKVLCTAQHRQLLDQVLELFGIAPDADFDAMRPNQTLAGLTSRLIDSFDTLFARERPDALLAQGDTTTSMAAALCSYYHTIPYGHVEAGLRTGNLYGPFPEEMNRLVAARIARWHFAPTQDAKVNLLKENIPDSAIFLTGNTVIDALLDVAAQCDGGHVNGTRHILVTSHRRENFGEPLARVCRAIRHLADTRSDVQFTYPVHPNPNVKNVVVPELGSHPRIRLVEPLDYRAFVTAMKQSYFILTDSGGVQEEAPALGKPVLVLRDETERPEAVSAGVVHLVGTDFERIVAESTRLLDDPQYYASMARGVSPYGDGHAAERIVDILRRSLVGDAPLVQYRASKPDAIAVPTNVLTAPDVMPVPVVPDVLPVVTPQPEGPSLLKQ